METVEKETYLGKRKVRTFSSDKKLVEERRKNIADKAVKVFLKKGYEKATMRDLGEACGMSAGNLYNYIGSKADILHLICIYKSKGSETYRYHRSAVGDESKTRVLSECMALLFQNNDQNHEYALFFNREIQKFSREDRNRLLASEMDLVSFFEELLREGMENGEFQVSQPALVSHNILMYGNDWALRRWFLKQHYTLEEYTEEQIRMVLELITAKTNQTARTGKVESTATVSSNTNTDV